jgi:hypothetical protein
MSQDGRADAVRAALRTFAGSIRPIDRVTMLTFDTTHSTVYGPGNKDGLPAAIERIPRTGSGGTDIGAALTAAVDELSRPGASPLSAAIVLFTDGEQNAAGPFADPDGPGWAGLAARVAALAPRTVRGFAFPLTNEVSGAELLKSVIPSADVPRLPANQLGDYLRAAADRIRIGIATERLASDLAATVRVEWPGLADGIDLSGSEVQISLKLTSGAKYLPLELVDGAVTTDLGTVTGISPRLPLPPNKPLSVTLTVRRPGEGFALGSTLRQVDTRLRLTGRIDSPWRQVVEQDLRGKLELPAIDTPTTVRGTITHGVPWFVVIVIILALLLVGLGLYLRWARRNPKLAGVLIADPPEGAPVRVELAGRRRVHLDRGRTGRALRTTGPCVIRGRRTGRSAPPTLVISYAARGGDPVTRHCPPGERQEIAGLRFWYLADGRDITPEMSGGGSPPAY